MSATHFIGLGEVECSGATDTFVDGLRSVTRDESRGVSRRRLHKVHSKQLCEHVLPRPVIERCLAVPITPSLLKIRDWSRCLRCSKHMRRLRSSERTRNRLCTQEKAAGRRKVGAPICWRSFEITGAAKKFKADWILLHRKWHTAGGPDVSDFYRQLKPEDTM